MIAQVLTAPPSIIQEYDYSNKRKDIFKSIENINNDDVLCGFVMKPNVSVTTNHETDANNYFYLSNPYKGLDKKDEFDKSIVIDMSKYGKTGNIINGTAYDIISNYGGIYELGKVNERRENMKGNISVKKYLLVDSLYKIFIRVFTAIIALVVVLAFWGSSFFPTEVGIIIIIALTAGITGLFIDRIGWRKKYRCL